jgi:hypothetical protein
LLGYPRMEQSGTETGRLRFITDGFLIFVFVFLVFEISINSVWATDHATSFVKLDYAMLSNHSVVLGHVSSVPPWTVDDFSYRGQNYSALAPGTPILALPFMAAAFALEGGFTAYGPALLSSETFVAIAGAVAAYLVYKIGALYFKRSTSIFLGLAFAFSTICWPFATYFFQSDVSAMLVLCAAYFALKAGRASGAAVAVTLISGIAVGVSFAVDYVNVVIIPILLVFLVIKKWESKRSMIMAAAALVVGALPGLALMGAYNLAIFGNPLMSTEQAYLGSTLLGEFSTPLPYGLALNLVSLSRGIFAFAPFAILGVLGYWDALRSSGPKGEFLLMLAIFLGILLPYSAWYDPYGGISFGPRFLVAGIPFLLIPAGFIIEQVKRTRTFLIYAVYAAGAVINGMGAFVSAVPPSTGFDVSPITSFVLPNFVTGGFDSLWAAYLGHEWFVGAFLILSLGVAIPVYWVETTRKNDRGSAASGIRTREKQILVLKSETQIRFYVDRPTKEVLNRVNLFHNQGNSLRFISKELGLAKTTVYHHIRKKFGRKYVQLALNYSAAERLR